MESLESKPRTYRQHINGPYRYIAIMLAGATFGNICTSWGSSDSMPLYLVWWAAYFAMAWVDWRYVTVCHQCGNFRSHPNHNHYSASSRANAYCNWFDRHGMKTTKYPKRWTRWFH